MKLIYALFASSILFASLPTLGPHAADDGTAKPGQLSHLELLGKNLFEDTSLSEPPGQACASCHDPRLSFTGNAKSPVAVVAAGSRVDQLGARNVPTIMYMAFSPPFRFVEERGDDGEREYTPTGGAFWDGRASSLSEQAKGPLLNPAEMNNRDAAAVVAKVRSSPYAPLMKAVFGENALSDDQVAFENVVAAIAAFESTHDFAPFTSKFDEYLRGNVELTAQEMRGFELFKDAEKGNCIACHAGDVNSRTPEDWLFTDFTYDNLGVPRNNAIPANAGAEHFDLGLCAQPGLAHVLPEGVEMDSLCGAFKVPTLRNVANTAPYFHNGALDSLTAAVSFYVTRDTSPERWFPRGVDGKVQAYDDLPRRLVGNVNRSEAPYDRKPGETPRLSDAEIEDLVAFLKTLSDTRPLR